MHGYGYTGHWFTGGSIYMFMGILILILIIAVVVFLFKSSNSTDGKAFHYQEPFDEMTEKEENALEILKKRYAKGEITKEQFEQIKKDIEG